MPRYRYTDVWPAVFSDLSVGGGVTVVRNPGEAAPPDGSTVILQPGDELVTTDPVDDPRLVEIPEPAPAAAPAAPAPAPSAPAAATPAPATAQES